MDPGLELRDVNLGLHYLTQQPLATDRHISLQVYKTQNFSVTLARHFKGSVATDSLVVTIFHSIDYRTFLSSQKVLLGSSVLESTLPPRHTPSRSNY